MRFKRDNIFYYHKPILRDVLVALLQSMLFGAAQSEIFPEGHFYNGTFMRNA